MEYDYPKLVARLFFSRDLLLPGQAARKLLRIRFAEPA